MNASLRRRLNIASCWASSRIALLDSVERYEDSYSISQEFCEWRTCLNSNTEKLEESILLIPNSLQRKIKEETYDADELLEL